MQAAARRDLLDDVNFRLRTARRLESYLLLVFMAHGRSIESPAEELAKPPSQSSRAVRPEF